MIISLRKHISTIVNTMIKFNGGFEIYEVGSKALPHIFCDILFTHEYMVIVDVSLSVDIENILTKLSSYIGKIVRRFESENRIYLYWFEGDVIIDDKSYIDEYITEIHKKNDVNEIQTHCILPQWLDRYIFQHLGAKYEPNHQRYDYNLELDQEENLIYLGTYFPRSFAESYLIFDNMFQVEVLRSIYSHKAELNILDIGCGTGGNLLGLLTAISKHCPAILSVNINCIDGNAEALGILNSIVERSKSQFKFRINISISNFRINELLYANKPLSELGIPEEHKFDFIMSFKFVCELIKLGYEKAYYNYSVKFLPLLSTTGVFLLVDVTTKHNEKVYNPILLNREINIAIKDLGNYKPILPLPCREHYGDCNNNCFTQKIFSVQHSQQNIDRSKIAYKMVVRNCIAELLPMLNDDEYIINGDIHNAGGESCPIKRFASNKKDGYNLNYK